MKTVIIANPSAAAGKVGKSWQYVHQTMRAHYGNSGVSFTVGVGDATRHVRRALDDGCERIVVVGGDGTVNEAVNGFFDPDTGTAKNPDAHIAVFPVGTGCDLARSVGFTGIPVDQAMRDSEVRDIDLGRATLCGHDGGERTRYFINVSSFGASGLIVDRVNRTTKVLGGKVSFFLGTLRGMLAYKSKRVRLQVDDHYDEDVLINTVAVANGRYFGGSMKIAPGAQVDDGLFDVILIGEVSALQFARYSGELYRGTHLARPEFSRVTGRVIKATPLDREPVLIDLDGEQPGCLPVRYELVENALKFYAPWKHAEASKRNGPTSSTNSAA